MLRARLSCPCSGPVQLLYYAKHVPVVAEQCGLMPMLLVRPQTMKLPQAHGLGVVQGKLAA